MPDQPAGPEPTFFAAPEDLRAWLEQHHASAVELWVGFYKKGSGRPSITWPESVDEALCFGWIDGVRKSLGADSYVIRFTPRRPGSIWSAVNIARVADLSGQGRMRPAGLATFAARQEARSAVYAHEQRERAALDAEAEQQFRASPAAWEFFSSQPAWYRRSAAWWVISAKRPETRAKRLATLIDDSAHRRTIRELSRPARPKDA